MLFVMCYQMISICMFVHVFFLFLCMLANESFLIYILSKRLLK